MNSLISLRRATQNDIKFLELIYNDKIIQRKNYAKKYYNYNQIILTYY